MSPSCGAKGSRDGAEAAVDTNSSSSSGKATAAMAERACAALASSAGVEMRDWVLTSLSVSEAAWEGGGCGERGGQVNSHPGRGHLDTHGRASLHGLGPADQGIPRRAWPDSRVTLRSSTQEQPGQETGSLTKELKKKKKVGESKERLMKREGKGPER